MDQPFEMESRGRNWRSFISSPISRNRLKIQEKTGKSLYKEGLYKGVHAHIVIASTNVAQSPENRDFSIPMNINHTVTNGDANLGLLECIGGQAQQKANDLPQTIAAAPSLLTAVKDSRRDTTRTGIEDQSAHDDPRPHPKSLNGKVVTSGSMAPSRHSIGAQAQISKPNSNEKSDSITSCLFGDEFGERQSSSTCFGEHGTSHAAKEPAAKEPAAVGPAAADPANSDDFTTSEQHQQSDPQADKVVLNLGPSSKELVYEAKKSGLLVGFPHKVEPSMQLQTRWNEEIEPRLWLDVEAFKKRTKPVVRRGRVMFPALSVELRMSGHVNVDGRQVTLVPTVWFLYDDKRWERDIRRFVTDLEWLSSEGFGTPEVQKGAPRLSTLRISADHLQLSTSAHNRIPLPGGDDLYIHVEEPQIGTACGLLCCATFVQNGEVRTQYLSRIGGLLRLDATSSAITTAHGLVEEISSRVGLCDIGDTTNSDEETYSDDDEEPPEQNDSEQCIGEIDLGVLDTMSWLQIPPTSIEETCFFRAHGLSMDELLARIKEQHEEEKSIALGKKPWETTRSADHQSCPTGDFSLLDLDDWEGLRNCYQSVGDSPTETKRLVHMIAQPGEVDGGRVNLLLRPEKVSQAILLPGTILFGTNGVTLHARKVVLDRPLGKSHESSRHSTLSFKGFR